jgi:hypothetical protein
MSAQKVLGLRTQPPFKIVWRRHDGWARFSRLDCVAAFHSSTEVFCCQVKKSIFCKESVHSWFILQMSLMEQHCATFYVKHPAVLYRTIKELIRWTPHFMLRILNKSLLRPIWVIFRPITITACWDSGFESRRGHGCPSLVNVVCFQVEISATGRSLVQRSPTARARHRVWSSAPITLYTYSE